MARKGLDIAALAAKLTSLNEKKGGKAFDGMSYANINDGRNVFRILPPHDKMETFGEEVQVHYGVGKSESNKNGSMVVCPTTHDEKAKCPVCELSRELWNLSNKGKDKEIAKQAKSLMRKQRVYFNVIDRSDDLDKFEQREEEVNGEKKLVWYNTENDEKESPVKVLGTGVGIYKDLIALIIDPEYGDITDPEEGLDVIITKTGKGQYDTKYDVKTVRKESVIGFEAWEEHLNDVTVLSKAKTYDEIASMMDGGSGDNDEGRDDSSETDEDEGNSHSEDNEDAIDAEIQAALKRRKNK